MARDDESRQMRVGEAKRRDIGKKRARIGPEAMDGLGVAPGDVVEITGGRPSSAVVWPADEDEKRPDVIRIDGQTRKNTGSALNDTVTVRKTSAATARSATMVPVSDQVTIDEEFTDFVKSRLKGCRLPRATRYRR